MKKGLKNIRKIPLFADGKEKVPKDSAAVVAYTANIYAGENGNKVFLLIFNGFLFWVFQRMKKRMINFSVVFLCLFVFLNYFYAILLI